MRHGQVRMSRQTSQSTSGVPTPIAVPSIPDKLYFRIGDVAKLCGVEAYVLRFWESEFPQLKPNKSGTGQRLYRRRDVELALRIKHLLYVDGYTIAGARQVFSAESRESKKVAQSELPLKRGNGQAAADAQPMASAQMQKLRGELREILAILSAPAKASRSGAASTVTGRNERGLFDS